MNEDPQDEAMALRMTSLAEQLDAANAAGRAIVGPELVTSPVVMSAVRALAAAGHLDTTVRLCDHLDVSAPAVAWWAPTTPDLIACETCHTAATRVAPSSCYGCRRPGQRTRRVLHLIEAAQPARAATHYLTVMPPVVVEVVLCAPCRGDVEVKPKKRRR